MKRRVFALALALALLPASARGQTPALEVTLPPSGSLGDGPAVRSLNVLGERKVRDLLRNGFPARLHFRAELWTSGGPFNSRLRATEWDVVVEPPSSSVTVRAIVYVPGAANVCDAVAPVAVATPPKSHT